MIQLLFQVTFNSKSIYIRGCNNHFLMANPDQKTILLEQAYDEIKAICTKFQDESGATDMEVKTLLRELARVWEKIIDDDHDIDRGF